MIRRIDVTELDRYGDSIRKIYEEALKFSPAASEYLLTRIRKSAENSLHPIVLLSFYGDRPVGFVFGFDFAPQNWWAQQIDSRLPRDFDWYDSTFELNELAVLPSHQKQNRGLHLMRELLDQMPHRHALLATKKEDNDHVIRFYRALGFDVVIDDFRYAGDVYDLSLILGWKRGELKK
ncbi:MAG: GNAT family N-acetyltransferase [Bacillota bacterium]|nr:GNAT family N-acetyltransferase [Bacillota bacterium]